MGLNGWWLALKMEVFSTPSGGSGLCLPLSHEVWGDRRRGGALDQPVTQNASVSVSLGHEAGSRLPRLSAIVPTRENG